ncbi:MAG: glycosyltransferase family 2 protein [Arenicellales bacterium]
MKESTASPKVGIIVLSWNKKDDTRACLESIRTLHYSPFRIYVVDNGSRDGSTQMLRHLESRSGLVLICNDRNLGYTGGVNQGMHAALKDGCDYLWLLNNDTKVEPDSLSTLVQRAEREPRLGLVVPVISFIDDPGRFNACGARIHRSRGILEAAKRPSIALAWHKESPQTLLLSGTALLITRQAALAIGDMDDRFFAYAEDRDYCLRAIDKGFLTAIEPKAIVRHSRVGDIPQRHFFYYMSRNRLLFWGKHCPDTPLVWRLWSFRRDLARFSKRHGSEPANRQALLEGLLHGLLGRTGQRRPSTPLSALAWIIALLSLCPRLARHVAYKLAGRLRTALTSWQGRNM